ETTRPEHDAYVYLEPLHRRNRAALGFDMASQPTRREDMERARDSGSAALSGRVTLVQEIDTVKQAGFLIYVPVYRSGVVPTTVAARRALLEGFVYAPFRADDLFAGIFGTEERPRAAFRIYDGEGVAEGRLLHDSRVGGIAPADPPAFTSTERLEMAGRVWTIEFAATPYFELGIRRSFVPFIVGVGLVLGLILFGLTRAQVRASASVRESEQRLRSGLESLPVGVVVADRAGRVTFAHPMSRRIWARGGGA